MLALIWLRFALMFSAAAHYQQYRLLVRPLVFLRDNMRQSAASEYRLQFTPEGDSEFHAMAQRPRTSRQPRRFSRRRDHAQAVIREEAFRCKEITSRLLSPKSPSRSSTARIRQNPAIRITPAPPRPPPCAGSASE